MEKRRKKKKKTPRRTSSSSTDFPLGRTDAWLPRALLHSAQLMWCELYDMRNSKH